MASNARTYDQGVNIMKMKWLTLIFAIFAMVWGPSFAAKPQKAAAAAVATPEIYSVKIDYTNGLILVFGVNFDPVTTTAAIGGESIIVDEAASSAGTLVFPFTAALANFDLGNYVLNLSTADVSFSLSIFIPLPLELAPPPPPEGPDCPCSTEWNTLITNTSPDGVADLTPYCSQDSGSFVTVQFFDPSWGNYWVLWTEWTGSEGYCELYLDGPYRTFTDQAKFDACATYLRNIVTVWGDQGNTCIY
jgi:hypothetical protein